MVFEVGLTGHNHHPWCTCGWCIGGGGGGRRIISHVSGVEKREKPTYSNEEQRQASATLERFRVHNYSSCFVNPNASCPVCSKSVFFYSNSNGSRVFFDELGPPWTKHPCTDNSASAAPTSSKRPTCRQHDEICEIVDAERKSNNNFIPKRRKKRRAAWKLLIVMEVEFENGLIRALLEEISSTSREKHHLSLFCTEKLVEDGDFVSKKGHVFSFPRRDTLESVEVVDGQVLGDLDDLEGGIDQNEIPGSLDEIIPLKIGISTMVE